MVGAGEQAACTWSWEPTERHPAGTLLIEAVTASVLGKPLRGGSGFKPKVKA